MAHLLQYDLELLNSINETSTLVVAARGIQISSAVEFLLSSYANEFSCCIVLNATSKEIKHYSNKLRSKGLKFTHINDSKDSAHTVNREKIYKLGGVFFGTSRCFLKNFINQDISVKNISSIIVLNGQMIKSHSNDALILRIFREHNSLHLVKAFITSPLQISSVSPTTTLSVSNLMMDELMSTFQCRSAIFLPRFAEIVKETFGDENSDLEIEVINIKQPETIQMIGMLIAELITDVTRYSAAKNNLGSKSKLTYKDALFYTHRKTGTTLYMFIKLLSVLYSGDPVTLYTMYSKMLRREMVVSDPLNGNLDKKKNFGNPKYDDNKHRLPTWGQSETAHILLEQIKEYTEYDDYFDSTEHENDFYNQVPEEENSNDSILSDEADDFAIEDFIEKLEALYVKNPKLVKIGEIVEQNKGRLDNLIFVCQNSTIKRILIQLWPRINVETHGTMKFYQGEYDHVILLNYNLATLRELEYEIAQRKKSKVEIESSIPPTEEVLQSENSQYDFDIQIPEENSVKKLKETAEVPNQLKITVLNFTNSIEEEIYYEEIKREKLLFEELIKQRNNMPLRTELEYMELTSHESESEEKNPDEKSPPVNLNVIIDTREQKTQLSYFLHMGKNILSVKTILIGDYVVHALDKEVVIERKSISDFKQSIRSERLYQQGQGLMKCKHPYLLLEFDGGIPTFYDYELDGVYNATVKSTRSYTSKLCKFIVTFPQIKIIWSNSHVFTTRMLRDMQLGRNTVISKKNESDEPDKTDLTVVREMLMSIPGVDSRTLGLIIERFKNMKELANSPIDKMKEILGEAKGKQIYNFFRMEF